MKRIGSQEIVQKAQLKVQARGSKSQVVWSLPAKSLNEADYMISIDGQDKNEAVGELNRYAFRVIKK